MKIGLSAGSFCGYLKVGTLANHCDTMFSDRDCSFAELCKLGYRIVRPSNLSIKLRSFAGTDAGLKQISGRD